MSDRVQRLRDAAQARHDATMRRAEHALTHLAGRGEPVTFRRVAEAAGVSRSWLYQQPELRAQIDQLRHRSAPRAAVPRPSRPPRTRFANSCAPTARRSPGYGQRTRHCASNSPVASAPKGTPQSPADDDPVEDMSTTTRPLNQRANHENDQEKARYADIRIGRRYRPPPGGPGRRRGPLPPRRRRLRETLGRDQLEPPSPAFDELMPKTLATVLLGSAWAFDTAA